MAFNQRVKSLSSNKNYAFHISVSGCGENETNGTDTFSILYGDLLFANNNISYNKCKDRSTCCISLYGSSETCNFSNFKDNNQTEGSALLFGNDSGISNHTISYCNVIGNKCGTSQYRNLFYCAGTTLINHCIIANNIANLTFYNSWKQNLTISDSYVDSKTANTYGTIIFSNLTESYDFNIFSLFYREKCVLDYKEKSFNLSYLCKIAEASAAELLSINK